jgi:hypothetical protein
MKRLFKKNYFHQWVMILGLFLSGCVGLSFVTYAKPNVLGGHQALVEKRSILGGPSFVVGEVSFEFSLVNSKGKTISIFPLPWMDRWEPPQSPPFKVLILINPHKTIARIDPSQIVMWKEGGAEIFPSGVIEVYDAMSAPAFKKIKETHPLSPIELPMDTNTCIWLQYDCIPFPVTEVSFLEIRGLIINGKRFTLPVVRFEKSKRRISL